MKNTIAVTITFICLTLLTAGCKKKEDIQPIDQTQNLSLKINSVSGNSEVNFSSVFTTESGQKYTLSMLRYYLSNIKLVKSDGSEHEVSGKYFLVSPAVTDYNLGDVPVGEYKGIKFSIGIDPTTNHSDPTLYPASNPLAIQSPAMHWSWNSGYIFLMLEGTCDTTAQNTDVLTYGQYSHGLFFHIGMDALYKTVDLSNAPFTVSADQAKVVTVKSDINKIFTNIDLKTENGSHTMGTMTLATRVANNIPTMFSIVQ